MEQSNVTKQMIENCVENGKVIQQDSNTLLYLTKMQLLFVRMVSL
ncbi:hypothetical protein [Clostridium oceanicum]